MTEFMLRMIRAALLDARIHEEIEAHRSATPQAFAVVPLASSAPGILLVFALLPPLSAYVYPVCGLWMLIAMIVAVRQALDCEGPGGTARAIAVCAIGFPIYVLLLMTALLALGPWPI